MQEKWVQSLGWEDPLEKEMATHSSILAWEISWTEEPGGLWFMGSQTVVHNWLSMQACGSQTVPRDPGHGSKFTGCCWYFRFSQRTICPNTCKTLAQGSAVSMLDCAAILWMIYFYSCCDFLKFFYSVPHDNQFRTGNKGGSIVFNQPDSKVWKVVQRIVII